MSGFARRLSGIPWRDVAREALSRTFLVSKALCIIHVFNSRLCSLAIPLGPSMLPTLNLVGDVVAVDMLSARLGRVSPGDVVLLISPENPRKTVAKRVLGMEGDAVTYLVDPGNSDVSKTVVVPKGHVWIQGDNIYDSNDSRQFGPVPYGLITGKIFCRTLHKMNIRYRIFCSQFKRPEVVSLIMSSLVEEGQLLIGLPRPPSDWRRSEEFEARRLEPTTAMLRG